MENQIRRSNRGGRREGAGRKSIYGATKNINFRLDGDLLLSLEALPNRSRFINDAIREKLKRDAVSG